MKHILPLIAAPLLLSIAPTHIHAKPATNITPLGRAIMVNGLQVRPIRVISDSRCPVDVSCAWSGELTLRIRVSGRRWTTERTISSIQPMKIAGGILSLTRVWPSRELKKIPRPQDYFFTFHFVANK